MSILSNIPSSLVDSVVEEEFHLPIKLQVKCVVLGAWGVGKSQLLQRYMADTFDPEYKPSVLEQFSFNVDVAGETCQVIIVVNWRVFGFVFKL
jgi:GTPase SAR1 family protein